jgi:hypothetical protein
MLDFPGTHLYTSWYNPFPRTSDLPTSQTLRMSQFSKRLLFDEAVFIRIYSIIIERFFEHDWRIGNDPGKTT